MDLLNVSTPQSVESGAQNNIDSAPLVTSATEPDKVINIKIDSTQIGGNASDEELLKGLLTDQRCHVCEAVLLFESQRLSHYEGKKHAQKLKLYLHNKRDEMRHTDSAGLLHSMPTDKDRCCELCNMVFTSPVVAKSHYEGKVHTKNLRKQSIHKPENNTEVSTLPSPSVDCATEDHISGSGNSTDLTTDPNAASSDSNKYCVLCEASFNNPQMALQHYSGRKHQRKKARQEMFKELEVVHEENPLSCAICNLQFNSVEMYQAHMQGNKHHTREKKVFKLCKSRQKSYSTFTDELAHYIEVQKARGLAPKIGLTLSKDEPQKGELTAGAGREHVSKDGQKIEVSCKPSDVGSMVMWFRVVDKSGMEFLASYTNNGMQKSTSDSMSNFSDLRIREDIIILKSFSKARDSGIYSCASLKNNQLKFGDITRLTGENDGVSKPPEAPTVKLNPSTTTLPCACENVTKQGHSMLCNPIILIPLAGSCGLLLLLILIIVVYCNRVRTRRCPHHYKKRPQKKIAPGKQQQQQQHT
ncbi:zinc finger matrin-type protein 1-like isoform X3 [Phyllopteryx taeniolatus]|uniref:zinc finger matrin-type protein 1-like isoform X3 n=1 Tax=Phyllopteryx taeniolatus TaxID=161469 RepID=UPI002AD301EE|nr:zinc finger matrin-type protein 1-like isoform X3 [Phyllopteryx taeniolatus]